MAGKGLGSNEPVSARKADKVARCLQALHSLLRTDELTRLAAWKESIDLEIPVCQNHTPSDHFPREAYAKFGFVAYSAARRPERLPYLLLRSQ